MSACRLCFWEGKGRDPGASDEAASDLALRGEHREDKSVELVWKTTVLLNVSVAIRCPSSLFKSHRERCILNRGHRSKKCGWRTYADASVAIAFRVLTVSHTWAAENNQTPNRALKPTSISHKPVHDRLVVDVRE
jgi:hypothetical protein